MKAKIWMSCLERPINTSGVNRSEILKTEETIVRVRGGTGGWKPPPRRDLHIAE
jgi:hypothetical protein